MRGRFIPAAHFTGWLRPEESRAWLRKTRALLFPPLWYETLGLVVVEAAAAGVPAIVSDRCAAAEFLSDGERGLHFSHGSIESLCAQIERMKKAETAERLGRNAYKLVLVGPVGYAESRQPLVEPLRSRPRCMNILLVSQPARDGVLRHVAALVDFLLAQGDQVHLAYSDYDASEQFHKMLDRVKAGGGQLLNLGVRNAPQPRDLPATIRLLALIRKVRPEVIHAHSSKAGALVRGLSLLGMRTPVFYTPHSYYMMHAPENRKARIYHLFERLFGRIGTTVAMSRCEATFAEEVIRVPPSQQLFSENGVDFSVFHPATPEIRKEMRDRFGLPREAKLIGSVGRFSPQKDPLTMYAAFAKVAKALPDVHVAHVGQGELQPQMDALIAAHGLADRCHRLPYMNDTSPFYRALDGFLLTSRYEGMSYAVLEALAANLPLVLTLAPGNESFAEHGFSHIEWAKPADVPSVAEAICHWREKLNRMETPNHRAIAQTRFSLDVTFLPVREAYLRAVRDGAP